ncbi:hypothetical protein LCGC14_1471700 [marine sediment metagenome]|uniref:Phage terminase large subunit N-terminal domain-containing protein n=1 Tax=marine sediment metagenome TaxID=412755 RepID=A0A0F9MDY6_9ZZZZ
MKIIDLFPICTIVGCPEATKGDHKHILKLQQEFFDADERFIALIGGYGSGKTLPACIMGHLLSISIPGNMGIVLRRSLPKLHDSTERIYLEILERSGESFTAHENRDNWPHRIIYANGSEVTFRETKDLGRFLGPEYGWYLVDEAQEEPADTVKRLNGRLRLPRAAKYLKGMICTNPPPDKHWIAKMWPKPGREVKDIKLKSGEVVGLTYRMIRSSTYDNPFLSSEYIAAILENNTPAEARRILEGHYGFQQEGDPVYPMMDPIKHVGDPETRIMTTYRVWDFGFRRPACTWHQMFRCKFRSLHWLVLDELMGENQEAHDFATEVITKTVSRFADVLKAGRNLVLDGGDTAGAQRTDRGPGPIIRLSRPPAPKGRPLEEGGFGLHFKHKKFKDIDPGLDGVRRCLKTQCKCGHRLLVLHRRCRTTIEALAGGYHFPKERPSSMEVINRKPVKDGYYDNLADTVRYHYMLFYKPLSSMENQDIILGIGRAPIDEWSWMETGVSLPVTRQQPR